MGRTLTPERQRLKEWAICLKGCGMTQEEMASRFGVERASIKDWLIGTKINDNPCFILDKQRRIVHNSGVIVENFYDGLPPNPVPQLFVRKAEDLHFLKDSSIDLIITSPPYNLGQEKWPMGGNGRTPRDQGVGYSEHEDAMPDLYLLSMNMSLSSPIRECSEQMRLPL